MRLLLLLLICLVFALPLSAKEIILFHKNQQVENYDRLVKSIAIGDVLVFETGDKFKVIEPNAGQGNSTKILAVTPLNRRALEPEQMALRIPLATGRFYLNGKSRLLYTQYIDRTLDGYAWLNHKDLTAPKLYRSKRGQFVANDLISKHTKLTDFLKDPPPKGSDERRAMTKSLLRFAKNAARVYRIGDFHTDQMVYEHEKQRWVLLDWTEIESSMGFKPAADQQTPFDRTFHARMGEFVFEGKPVPFWADNLLRKMNVVVRKTRQNRLPGCRSFFSLFQSRVR